MDKIDLEILNYIQFDATMPTHEIAERVNLTTTPCWRRLRNLERDGVIRSKVGLLDRDKLNLGVDVFVAVRTNQHNAAWFESFSKAVAAFPEVVEFYRMSGQIDYLMRVVVPDIDEYDRFYKRLIAAAELNDVSSSFAMERIKYTTALPLQSALSETGKSNLKSTR